MIYAVYCIRDDAAQVFLSPVLNTTDALARRNFENAMFSAYESNQLLGTHPQDFSLYHVADFDEETGLFEQVSPAVQICTGRAALYSKGVGKDEVS